MSRNRLRFLMPLAGEFAYSRLLTGSVLGRDPANAKHRVAGLLDLGIHRDRINSTQGVYLPHAHNSLVDELLKLRDTDYFVWLEHDHQFDYRMVEYLEHIDEPVVGIRYYTRDPIRSQMMVARFVNQDDPEATDPPFGIRYLPYAEALRMVWNPGLYRVDFVPHGMTAVRRDVYERLARPWYVAGAGNEYGDDVYFMAQCFKAEIPVYCSTELYSGHITTVVIDDDWHVRELRRQWLELQFGEMVPEVFGGAAIDRFLPEGFVEQMSANRIPYDVLAEHYSEAVKGGTLSRSKPPVRE